jgi:Zn-dependent peptidase ImmA (M78 family)
MLYRFARKNLQGWNRRILTERDFYHFCLRQSVTVVEAVTDSLGRYVVYKERPFIIHDPSLRGGLKLWVLWHEAGHHLLHTPEPQCFGKVSHDKFNYEANFIASVALIPFPILKSKTYTEIQEENDYPDELMWLRKDIYERFKI